ncbi:MAG: LysM peptidoglycan-binding domain-containing protein [Methylovulum sp.]|nr:LysM peptidoglycan-binding domain-containing protein [Methylovulum sp.]
MAFRKLSGLVFFCFFSMVAHAEDIQINPTHPDQYTVVRGDTLWDISGKFLKHPWQWPQLWNYNAQIKNPNLIYPGDTVYFSIVNGKPQLSFSSSAQYDDVPDHSTCILREEDFKNGRTKFPVSEDGKLLPCIRETHLDQAVNLIPMDKIAQFLTSPSVVGANDLPNAPYVVAIAGEHVIAGAGDKLYVRSIPVAKSRAYTVYRSGDTYRDASTGEILGYEAKYIADASLQQAGDPASLSVTKSSSEIRRGDRVMPNVEEELTLNYFPRPPEHNITGSIIGVLDGVSQIGLFNVVVIDKGTRDGLLVGHELDVYQDGKVIADHYSALKNDEVKLPNELAGVIMVFRPFERVSYALVMKASQAIHVLDKVQTP